MGRPFSDITIYNPSIHKQGTVEWREETALVNFVSDLYMQNMNGYKPPKTTRITIQPTYHDIWDKSWKTGSIVAIAPYFNSGTFSSLDKEGKYKVVLDLIQTATIQLSDQYHWDKTVFEKAYQKTLDDNFSFRVEYPGKLSRDRKKRGSYVILKTEFITSTYIEIYHCDTLITKKLFEKPNQFWYDYAYYLGSGCKWFDNDRFGVAFGKGKLEMWYSLLEDKVAFYQNGQPVQEVNFGEYFLFN